MQRVSFSPPQTTFGRRRMFLPAIAAITLAAVAQTTSQALVKPNDPPGKVIATKTGVPLAFLSLGLTALYASQSLNPRKNSK